MKMQLNGVEKISAAKATVRGFVLDPNRVGACLPDLQELQVADERHMTALVKIGIGPIRGKFKMEVELNPLAGGDEITMSLKGSGMGNGLTMSSAMRLVETGAGTTELHWSADAAVSGPLVGVGGRLLEGQAKKTTEQLFANIQRQLEAGGQAAG